MTNSQLDKFIAEHVMGWTRLDHPAIAACGAMHFWSTGDEQEPTVKSFFPTTDIGDAHLVLLKLRQSHTAKIWTLTGNSWRVSLFHGGVSVSAWEETLPLAICKAALAAIEAKGIASIEAPSPTPSEQATAKPEGRA